MVYESGMMLDPYTREYKGGCENDGENAVSLIRLSTRLPFSSARPVFVFSLLLSAAHAIVFLQIQKPPARQEKEFYDIK